MSATSSSNDVDELEWIRLRKEISEPLNNESKIWFKIKENPLVPIGAIATVGCIVFGIRNLYLKNSKKQQFYMRGRILSQGFTVAMLLAGLSWTASKQGAKQ